MRRADARGEVSAPLRAAAALALPALAALLSLASAPSPASAQATVVGQVTDARTGRPLEGVVVRLVAPGRRGEGGEEVAGAFTDADGRFRLELERPGRHRLEAERIGYESFAGEAFVVELGGRAERDVRLEPEGVRLSGIEVTSRRRCSTEPATARATQRLWREARRALEAARWTAEHASVEMRTRNYERRLDADLNVVEVLSETRGFGLGASPYHSLPAEELSERGYADPRGDYVDYYAPDADALLSDTFRRDHCFWVTRDDAPDPGWVGLAFEPAEGREVPEIEGVLWLDETTAELKRLDFDYVNLPFRTSSHAAGGRVDFLRLPSGPWLVRRWSIRMPRMERDELRFRAYRREELRVAGYEEEGGEVVRAASGGRTLYDTERATVAGVVYDSVRGQPLAGARVELAGTGRADTTGAEGHFRFPAVPEGSYRVRSTHPSLAALGLGELEGRADVAPGERVETHLAVPGPGTLARRLCPDAGDGEGAVVGRVRGGDGSDPVPGADVAAVWPRGDGAAEAGDPEAWTHRRVRADGQGRFRLCGVPAGRTLALRAEAEGGVGAVTETRLEAPAARVVELDLSPDGADRLASLIRQQGLGADGAGAGGAPGAVRGTVEAAGDGRPLAAAEVRLDGERAAVTDSAGRFELRGVEPGRHRVRVSYLGFESREALVRVPAGDTVESAVRMQTDPVPLPELAVRVEGGDGPAGLAGFRDRMRTGGGHYVTREEIEETSGDDLADVLREVPGLQVRPCPGGGGDCVRSTRSQQSRLGTLTPSDRTPGRRRDLAPGEGGQDDGEGAPLPDRDTVPQARSCGIAYFVDGAPVALVRRDPSDPADPSGADFELGRIAKQDVEAVEVYSGPAQIPVRFRQSVTGCVRVAIVVWTRRGGR